MLIMTDYGILQLLGAVELAIVNEVIWTEYSKISVQRLRHLELL